MLSVSAGTRNVPGWALLITTLVLLCGGCGTQDADRPAAARLDDARAPAVEPLPDFGRVRVEFSEGLVSVLSHAAPRDAILEELAAKSGFLLELGDVEPSPMTLRIENMILERALPLLLREVPYQIDYVFDPELDRHVVTLLSVGPARPMAEADTNRKVVDVRPTPPATRPDREFRERLLRERLRREAPIQDALLADLHSSNVATRAEAASEIEAEGLALDRLLEILAEDPDPGVREASVQQLGNAGSHWAVRGLLYALGDAEPAVVLRAIEALESEGDDSVIPDLEPLLDDRDPAIREATREALDSLQ